MLSNQHRSQPIIAPRPLYQTSTFFPNHSRPKTFNESVLDHHQDLDFDLDVAYDSQSLASSPVSTQSLLSQGSGIQHSPLSTFDSIPTVPTPRGYTGPLFEFPQSNQSSFAESSASLFANTDMMQTESWHPNGHLTPRSTGRASHQRESSLSSLGSNGPASPYSQNTSNPYIAVTDSAVDFHGLPNAEDFSNYHLAKSHPGAVTHDSFYTNYPTYGPTDHSAIASYPRIAAAPKRRNDRGLLSPDHLIGSRPVSVASSITSDSPATPAGEPEEERRQRNVINTLPKLDRTMTDVYSDELYNPNFTISSTTSGPTHTPISPSNDLFAQRLQAANSQHLNAVGTPVSATSRSRSPFRQGSPLASVPMNDFSPVFNSAHHMREQIKAERDAQALQQQMAARSADTSTPQTISPKDAMLEFHDGDGDANFPLFPQQGQNRFDTDAITKAITQSQPAFDNLALDTTSFNNFLGSSQLPTGIQVPQQYPFIAQSRQQSTVPSLSNGSLVSSRMGSTETGLAGSSNSSPQRPSATGADGGTYSCTYHGCTLRFETPALLQKHKREGHRQAHGLVGSRRAESVSAGMTTNLLNSQAGPHRCDRINPSTGKPCNTVFSRPYDLTRHEDTIHNARKQKVRCDLCTDEKTFSRADALTRHYRVCHPDVEFHGKQRKRGGQGG